MKDIYTPCSYSNFAPGLLSPLCPKSQFLFFFFFFALTTSIHFDFAVQLEMVSSGSVTSFRGCAMECFQAHVGPQICLEGRAWDLDSNNLETWGQSFLFLQPWLHVCGMGGMPAPA